MGMGSKGCTQQGQAQVIRERGGRNRWGRGERWSKGPGDRTGRPGAGVKKEGGVRNPFSDRKGPRGGLVSRLGPLLEGYLTLSTQRIRFQPQHLPWIYFFYIFCEINIPEKVRSPGVLKGRLKPQPTASLLFPSQAGQRPHRAELAPSSLQAHAMA